jgi:hypothetical protein
MPILATDILTNASGSWQDWLVVAGYLSFAGFVMWRVLR